MEYHPLFNDQVVYRVIGWIMVALMTVTAGLIIYIWRSVMDRLDRIERNINEGISKQTSNTTKLDGQERDIENIKEHLFTITDRMTRTEKDLLVMKVRLDIKD